MKTGQRIALLRKQAGLNQEALAQKLFVSRELVSKWETSQRRPDQMTIIAISELFGVSPNELSDFNETILDELSSCIPYACEFTAEQLTDILNSFLETLSKTDRAIFISRYYHGMKSSETADLLRLKETNIRQRLMKQRKKFADLLKEYSNE